MKTLNTGVKTYKKGNRIGVDSPYWVERRKPKCYELADIAIVVLALLTLIAIFYS